MTDVYQRLATHLDNLPAGYPATETGVELRILKRLFTPEEAEIAMGLGMMPEPVEAIAARLGREADILGPVLHEMSRKGQIFRVSKNDNHAYMAAQFVVGIWEYHVNDLDEDLIRDVNEYIPYLMKKSWTEIKTKQMRVIPVAQSVNAEMSVTPYEAAEEIIRQQSKIVLAPCICRREHEMLGKGCGKPLEACLTFGSGAYYYEQNGLGREISQDEALGLLKTAEEAGLVLQPSNSQKPMNICMCCGCCCQILKNMRTLDKPALAVHSNYLVEVIAEDCTACETCVERCQMDAISVEEVAMVDLDRCIGCGLCITDCPTDAMVLKKKAQSDQYLPPGNTVETYINMATERGKI